jgi:hypothetical protein
VVRLEFFLSHGSSQPFGSEERRKPGLVFPTAQPSQHCHRAHAAAPLAARYLIHDSFHQPPAQASRGLEETLEGVGLGEQAGTGRNRPFDEKRRFAWKVGGSA